MSQNWVRQIVLISMLACAALAQTPSTPASNDAVPEWGGYKVQQSIELGYRFSAVTGSDALYDTLLDQHQGPRVLEQSFTMRSPEHTGGLFDDLSLSSFGWGGDPQNVARARASKYGIYDFTALFRRDRNSFDYNLFANPLNPSDSVPTILVNSSPHTMDTTRRMYDFDLSILPRSKFTVRLGFSRNRSEGPSFSSFHEGTDVLLNQPWNFTSNEYRIGFDFKGLPSTTISYDQFVTADKNDTNYSLATFAAFSLPTGTPVEFGLPWNTLAGSPCPIPLVGSVANPVCNGYFSYSRTQRVRNTTPTEQLSINSNYFQRLNLMARASYSSGTSDSPYNESFDGLVLRTGERQFTFTGPISVRRVAVAAEFGATLKLTDHLSLNESFRFDNFRIPGEWNSTSTATAGTSLSLLSPLGPTTTTAVFISNFLGQKSYYNLAQLEFSTSKRFGAHLGYRFRHRHVFKAEPELRDPEAPFETFEGDSIDINEHGPVVGFWFRPSNNLKANVDVELSTADNFLTRISPRQRQNYRGRLTYKSGRWATLTGSANFWEARNGESDTNFKQHYRNAGFVVTLLPSERFNLDLAYNYTDALQDAYVCFNGTFFPAGTIVNGCPTFDPTNPGTVAANPNPNWIYSNYTSNTHYFSGIVSGSPAKRIRLALGYGLIHNDGDTTILNPLQPFGTLHSTYQQPLGSVSYSITKQVSLNAYWNYDQYRESSFIGPTLPRYFHDNRTVLSAKYEF